MKKIRIFLTLMLLSVAAAAFAEDITVKGVVSDASNGDTLPGASVVLKGTTVGVVTNIDGEYEITVPSDGVVVVSCIGYTTRKSVSPAMPSSTSPLTWAIFFNDINIFPNL